MSMACAIGVLVLAALGVLACVWMAVTASGALRRGGRTGLVAFAVFAVVAIIHGGVGHGFSFRFQADSGIYDAGSRFDPETGIIHAVWTYDPWVSNYAFKWFYTYKYGGESRGPFVLPDAVVSDGVAEYQLQTPPDGEWESFLVTCYTAYVPPIHVVTNGVYHVDGVMRSMDTRNSDQPKFVTPGIAISVDLETGETRVLTPTNRPPSASLTTLNEEIQ